jgi:hypothetical protein
MSKQIEQFAADAELNDAKARQLKGFVNEFMGVSGRNRIPVVVVDGNSKPKFVGAEPHWRLCEKGEKSDIKLMLDNELRPITYVGVDRKIEVGENWLRDMFKATFAKD